MARLTYMAMLEPTDTGLGVSFPDLPGCVSSGRDSGEAVRNAEEALSLHLEGMAEDGETYPEPGDLKRLADRVWEDPAQRHLVFALVTVEAPDEAERVNIYLTKSLLERIDARAKADGINRSAFFNQAARAYMGEGQDQLDLSGLEALLQMLNRRLGDVPEERLRAQRDALRVMNAPATDHR